MVDAIIVDELIKYRHAQLPNTVSAIPLFRIEYEYQNVFQYNKPLEDFLTKENIRHRSIDWCNYHRIQGINF